MKDAVLRAGAPNIAEAPHFRSSVPHQKQSLIKPFSCIQMKHLVAQALNKKHGKMLLTAFR